MKDIVTQIQLDYPKIYLACHKEHVKERSNKEYLSSRDSTLLAHISSDDYSTPTQLAKHLNISLSTLSEALSKLEKLKFIHSQIDPEDSRKRQIRLSSKGLKAMKDLSVLDTDKLTQLLRKLSQEEMKTVATGISILAKATAYK